MTDPEFDFDEGLDVSKILKDIDAANEALDTLDVRADALTATLNALLRAQSQSNPYGDSSAADTQDDTMQVEIVAVVEETRGSVAASTLANGDSQDKAQGEQANGTH